MRFNLPISLGTLLIASFAAVAAPAVPAAAPPSPPRQAVPPAGRVVLWDGGTVPADLTKRLSSPATGPAASRPATAPAEVPQATTWVDLSGTPSATHQLLDQVLIDPGFLADPPPPALVARLAAQPGLVGLGVPEGTAVVVDGRRLRAVGTKPALAWLPPSISRPAERPLLRRPIGDREPADLIALSRAALDRLGPIFPPEPLPQPVVASGTLLPCGGGKLSDDVWKRFIALAGGPDAPIVVLPLAAPDPDAPSAGREADVLRRHGANRVTVLAQRTREAVASPEFAAALAAARGVWFVGGRQWKYTDAYEGTAAEALFRDVLARGGVVGGSSAGAAIQAQYMVRGDPLGNRDISAEGYERGLGFLPGTAIDIHVAERKRLPELVGLIKARPALLGLGLDEGSALEVHGHSAVVLGTGKVTVVAGPEAAAESLKAGDRYDLVARRRIAE